MVDVNIRGMVSLAVSIVLYRTDHQVLTRTVASLAIAIRQSTEKGLLTAACRLLLIDHSPDPIPPEQQECLHEMALPMQVEYHFVGGNPGFGAGHNRAFCHAADNQYFLVANPDLEFTPDSLGNGLAFLTAHPEIGLLAPALVETDGSLRPACFRSPDMLTLFARLLGGSWAARRSYHYECRDWDATSPVFNPPLISGCCMLFRGSTFRELGGFDPGYFLYFEDFELSRRAQRQCLSAYCPTMKVVHHGGGAASKGLRHQFYFLRSAARFFWQARDFR